MTKDASETQIRCSVVDAARWKSLVRRGDYEKSADLFAAVVRMLDAAGVDVVQHLHQHAKSAGEAIRVAWPHIVAQGVVAEPTPDAPTKAAESAKITGKQKGLTGARPPEKGGWTALERPA